MIIPIKLGHMQCSFHLSHRSINAKYGKQIFIGRRAKGGMPTLVLCQRSSVEPMSKSDSGPTSAAGTTYVEPAAGRVFVFAGMFEGLTGEVGI